MQPSSPIYFLDMPFAENGDKTIIPAEEATADGRATQSEGFPEITQQLIASGGIAPNRWDFNGMFFLLSQFAHWEQSGGQATWNSELGYTPPSIVYYNKVYYVCITESGPETDAGAVIPSEDDGTYWETLWDYLSDGQSFVKNGDTVTLTGDTTGSGTFDSSGSVSIATTTTTATTATKLGSSTVGGTARGIYLSSGKATAMSATVGSTSTPVYLKSGTITACSSISEASAYKRAKNGYIKFSSSGIIMQWGVANFDGAKYIDVALPIAFPNAVFSAVGSDMFNISTTPSKAYALGWDNATLSLSTLRFVTNSTSTGTFAWFAVGY